MSRNLTAVNRRSRPRLGFLLSLVSLGVFLASVLPGCTKPSAKQQSVRSQTAQGQLSVKLLESVTEMLNRLDEADPAQAMRQIVDRLNQWGSSQDPPAWHPDPLVSEVKSKWPNVPGIDRLDKLQFGLDDALALQEALWLKKIADRAGKDTDLALASALFDWTVRNIQLVGDDEPEAALGHLPNEILLLGRGTSVERAWIFILLARQMGLDGAMLATADETDQQLEAWVPAIWIDGHWHLFDSRLGLPIAGANGKAVATLDEVQADDNLLRQLDVDGQAYPMKASDLTEVVAWVESSPYSLSRRMQLIESKLPGNQKLVLSFRPSRLVDEVKAAKSPLTLDIWSLPFERRKRRAQISQAEQRELILERAHIDLLMVPSKVGESKRRRPENEEEDPGQQQVEMVFPLRTGRPLQLLGEFDGERGAKHFLMLARPSAQQLTTLKVPLERRLMERAKQDATYWLGLVAVEQGKKDSVAVDLFQNKTLEAFPDGRWTAGARYNLARAYEAAGQTEKAIDLYQADDSPQRQGNLLRAKRLQQSAAPDQDLSPDAES